MTPGATPIVIIGAGGHGAVVADAARASGHKVLGFVDADPTCHGSEVLGLPVLGGDEAVFDRSAADFRLVSGIGSTASTAQRQAIHERFVERGYGFATVVHPTASVADGVSLGDGTVVMAGAVVQPRCRIAENVIINTGAQVDHNGNIGAHCHIAPGAVLSGNVTVGDGAHVGSGAVIIQGVTIGATAVCAAGAVVIRNVDIGTTVAGNPAERITE